MEIADVFVVNKADRDGVERVVAEIETMLGLVSDHGRLPEIVKTAALRDEGIDRLLAAVEAFRREAGANGLLERKRRDHLARQLDDALRQRLAARLRERVLTPLAREAVVERLVRREVDPFTAAGEVLAELGLA